LCAVHSFLEVASFLLQQPGVKFLYSSKFNQDSVEAYYGRQRAKGGRNDNPTVQQFCDNAVSLRLQRSEMIKALCLRDGTLEIDDTPLPKRKKHN